MESTQHSQAMLGGGGGGGGVLVAGRTRKRARSDFAQVQIPELEIFPCTPLLTSGT